MVYFVLHTPSGLQWLLCLKVAVDEAFIVTMKQKMFLKEDETMIGVH